MTHKNSNINCITDKARCSLTSSDTSSAIKNTTFQEEKVTITYYYDALCGWCYGFTDVFKKFQSHHQNSIEFKIVSGGLFLDKRIGNINTVAPYIKEGAYKSVEQVSGIYFGELFLEKLFGIGIEMNSLPPAIAMCVVKENKPEQAIYFAELLLKAVYRDGINSTNFKEYSPYVEQIGFNITDFNHLVTLEHYKNAALNDFAMFSQHKISGMPTLVVDNGIEKKTINNGYASFDDLDQRLSLFLK